MERAVSSAIGYALAGAICLALASALQHQAATGEHGYRSGIHLLWRLAHRPRWMAGLAVSGAGLVLHAAALHAGALAVVQPLLVTAWLSRCHCARSSTVPGRRPGRRSRRRFSPRASRSSLPPLTRAQPGPPLMPLQPPS
jgi:hypothetical protein